MRAGMWPLFIALSSLMALIAGLLSVSLSRTQGHLIYALDDAYIHMAIAKNLSQHGVWGVTRYAFSSSSSSILWTLSLAVIYALFGVNEVSPFVLNVIFALLIAVLVMVILRREVKSAIYMTGVWFALMLLTPVAPLVFSGMEHIAQIGIDIAFVYAAARFLSSDDPGSGRSLLLLAALSALATLIRFEGLFLVFVACILFVARRRFGLALLSGLSGFLPIGAYGVYSVANGQYFFPNSVLIKRAATDFAQAEDVIDTSLIAFEKVAEAPHVLILVLMALSVLYFRSARQGTLWETSSVMLVVFALAAVLHLLLAQTGWFYRYEAYLMALGILAVGLALGKHVPDRLLFNYSRNTVRKSSIVAAAVLVGASAFIPRGYLSHREAPQATRNIYEQHYQLGRFLKTYYEGQVVAVNDIGAINFFADTRCLDLWGLSTIAVTQARLEDRYNTDFISNMASEHGARIAVVYEVWYVEFGGLPKTWNLIGQWSIEDNVIAGSPVVSFYAVDPSAANDLYANLQAFSAQLPPTVQHWERNP